MPTQKHSPSKTVLITGASTGFGRDTAETLTHEGHHVFASFRDIVGRNKSHADALRAKHIKVVELDVTSKSSVESAVGSVLSQAGRIDVLINNAGIASAGVSEAFTSEQVRDLFEVNVFGVQRVLSTSGIFRIYTAAGNVETHEQKAISKSRELLPQCLTQSSRR